MKNITCFILLLYLCGCVTVGEFDSKQINHIVLLWQKKPLDNSRTKALVVALKKLEEIEVVKKITVGEVIKSNRKIVDDSYNIALLVIFNSQKDMDIYIDHPLHKKIVSEEINPYVQKILVYDFLEN